MAKSAQPPLEVLTNAVLTASGKPEIRIDLACGLLSATLHADPFTKKFRSTRIPASVFLEALAKKLRKDLEEAGFPTDKEYVWIKQDQKPWRPDNDPERKVTDNHALRSWFEQLCAATRPLSKEFVEGRLLYAIDELLRSNPTSFELDRSVKFGIAYANFILMKNGDPLYSKLAREQERRAKGPEARKEQSRVKRLIVGRHAQKLWREKAMYRNDRFNTAAEIKDAVNLEICEKGLRPIGPKRIAAYISEGIRGRID